MKRLIMILPLLLSGCVVVNTHHTKIWLLCYRDETVLPNGMYQSNELQLHGCNKRRQLQIQYKIGTYPSNDVLKGFEEWKKKRE